MSSYFLLSRALHPEHSSTFSTHFSSTQASQKTSTYFRPSCITGLAPRFMVLITDKGCHEGGVRAGRGQFMKEIFKNGPKSWGWIIAGALRVMYEEHAALSTLLSHV